MQVLEKILQEIGEAKKEPLFRLCDYAYMTCQAAGKSAWYRDAGTATAS